MWNIQNGEEKKYPAVENCILAFCGVLCYTVNRCRFCKQGIARKITECSRPSTRKTKLKETNGYERQKVTFIVQAAVIAALYVVLTFVANALGLASHTIQVRFSEALCILPVFTPAAIPGLWIGCLLANLLTGAVIYDVIFGSIATLLAAVCTYLLRNHKIACTFPPVIFNMIIVPFVLVYAYGIPAVYFHGVNVTIPFNTMTVGIGEVISVCVLGSILMRVLAKYRNVMFRATAQ